MKRRIFRQEQGFSGQFVEFPFAVGAAGVDELGDVPVEVGAGGDDVAVHGLIGIHTHSQAGGLGDGKEKGGRSLLVFSVQFSGKREEEEGEVPREKWEVRRGEKAD
jgi:hypothetical protein